jgi:hypothetical protein
MNTVGMTAMSMPGMAGMEAHGAHGAHLEPIAPRSGDPRFIAGSTGEFGQSKTIAQKNGPAFGGQEVAKEQNGNDKKQNNYGVTDANFTRTLGLIANPDTGEPMSYAQTMQAYNAAGAIEALYPDVYARLVANQNAGRGTVLGGALALMGITKSDGFGGASLDGISQQQAQTIQGAQLGNLGPLKDYVLDTRDFKGREWNRAHHPGSHWKGLMDLAAKGYSANEAALLTGDSMTSWSGRVLGSNNQDGNENGFADDEMAGLKYMVLMEQVTGKPAIESVLGAHADTHLPEDKLTNPKINKLIGLPENFRPKTQDEINMVAGRIRQYALDPNVKVNQGEFEKFVKAGAKTAAGQQLNASGLLNQVQFEAENNNNDGGGGGNNEANADEQTPTGLGDGLNPAAISNAPLLPEGPGSPTIDTRPTLENLGVGGPFPVINPETGKLNKRLQEQLMTAFVDMLYQVNNSAILDDKEERDAFVDGAKKGATFLKDAVAVDPDKVASLKDELASALKDGSLSDAERESLSQKLAEAGMADVAKAVKDNKVTDKELATLQEQVDGAASTKLERDVTAALEDGKLTAEERKTIESRLGKSGLDELEKGLEDGSVTKEELEAISKGVEQDAKAGNGRPDKAPNATADAKAGADTAADGTPTDPSKPEAGTKDAKNGATGDKPAGDKPAGATGDKGDKPAGDKPAGDKGDKPAGDKPAGDKGGDKGGDKPAGDK